MARNFTDSNSNIVRIIDPAAIDLPGPITVSSWNKPNNTTQKAIFSKTRGEAVNSQYSLLYDQPNLIFRIITVAGLVDAQGDTTTVSTGNWHHVCGVYNMTDLRIYLDGVLDGTPTANTGTILTGAGDARVGLLGGTFFPFDGDLAEMAVWDTGLSAVEVAALAKGVSPNRIRRTSLAGYWPLYGNSFPEIDLSGNRDNGIQVGTVGKADHAPIQRYVPATVKLPFVPAAPPVVGGVLGGLAGTGGLAGLGGLAGIHGGMAG